MEKKDDADQLPPAPPSLPNSGANSTPIGDSSSRRTNATWVVAATAMVIILILASVGFNIFVYLAEGTQKIANKLSPIIHKVLDGIKDMLKIVLGTADQTVHTAAQGAEIEIGRAHV